MVYETTTLGKMVAAPTQYSANLLQPLLRRECRGQSLHQHVSAIATGWDEWFALEFCCLDANGCPLPLVARFRLPYDSKYLIESKSFKLYLNSYNFYRVQDIQCLKDLLTQDLSAAANTPFHVTLWDLTTWQKLLTHAEPEPIDCLDGCINSYEDVNDRRPDWLVTTKEITKKRWVSHHFRSNCPVTGQPDWASVDIDYHGPTIIAADLYRYLLSYRQHQGFHEQCIEQIFVDIYQQCHPETLTVRGYFTRRGGLDINPVRSTQSLVCTNHVTRFGRQ